MRIAYVINSTGFGGAECPVPAICRVFQEAGHEVTVFALYKRDALALPAWKKAKLNVIVRSGNSKDHFSALLWLYKNMRTYKPDLIWTSLIRSTLLGQIVGQTLRIPVVSWQHSEHLSFYNRVLLYLRRQASRLWIADSQSVADMTTRVLHIPQEKLMCWPIFRADPSHIAQPWQPGTPIRFGSLGRLHPVKGYDILLKAISLLDSETFSIPFHITIAGEGPDHQKLQHLISHYNLQNHVTLAGFLQNPHPFLASLHLYLQPSLWEGFCIAAHEAMQVGLPIIASYVGELKYSVQNDETGWSIPPSNPFILSDAIKNALRNPHLLAPMGTRAKAYIDQKFSPEIFTKNGNLILQKIHTLTGLK